MTKLEELERLLPSLSRGEKAQLLQWVVQDLGDAFPGVDIRPDVCGGQATVVRTRIPIWLLEEFRRQGVSDEGLLHAYPGLRAEDLSNAWAYVRSHRMEIDQQIKENEDA